MPEGHTLHLLARDHTRDLAGHAVAVSSPQGRASGAAARVDGCVLDRVEAYGKHLFYEWRTGDVLHVHLGLFGRYRRHRRPAPDPGPNVRLRMEGRTWAVDLSGPTACHLLDPGERDAIVARLGPDPLRPGADPELAWARLRRRRATIGAALMDQAVVAGVGNVFRAEALFLHGMHPERPAAGVTREEFDALWATLGELLRRAVKDGRIITVDDAELERPRGELERLEGRYVYRRERCHRCGHAVRRWEIAGRWAYACEACQPPPRPAGARAGQPRPR